MFEITYNQAILTVAYLLIGKPVLLSTSILEVHLSLWAHLGCCYPLYLSPPCDQNQKLPLHSTPRWLPIPFLFLSASLGNVVIFQSLEA